MDSSVGLMANPKLRASFMWNIRSRMRVDLPEPRFPIRSTVAVCVNCTTGLNFLIWIRILLWVSILKVHVYY